MTDVVYAEESYAIIGACFNVYNNKGSGFLEAVYQECLEIEMGISDIPFQRQPELKLTYSGVELKQTYRLDFICYGKIVVELKASSKLVADNRAQVLNYLHASTFKLGLLVNFGHSSGLEYERIVL